MPMLTTLRMRLPVAPVHEPLTHAVGEVAHAIEDLVHVANDVLPVDGERRVTRQAQRDMEYGAVLAHVDVVAEHRVDALAKANPPDEATSSRIVSAVMRFFE